MGYPRPCCSSSEGGRGLFGRGKIVPERQAHCCGGGAWGALDSAPGFPGGFVWSGDLGPDDFDREGFHGFGEALKGGFVIADADDGTA